MTFSHFWASKSDIGMRTMARVEEPIGAFDSVCIYPSRVIDMFATESALADW